LDICLTRKKILTDGVFNGEDDARNAQDGRRYEGQWAGGPSFQPFFRPISMGACVINQTFKGVNKEG